MKRLDNNTFESLAPWFKAKLSDLGFAPSSILLYVSEINVYLSFQKNGGKSVLDLGYPDLLAYIGTKKGDKKKIRFSITVLRKFYREAVLNKVLPVDLTLSVKFKVQKPAVFHNILPFSYLDKLYGALSDKYQSKFSITEKLALGFLIFQGLPAECIYRLNVSDLLLADGVVRVRPSVKSNGRRLALNPVQALDIAKHIAGITDGRLLFPKGQGFVFERLIGRLSLSEPRIFSSDQVRASVICYWIKSFGIRKAQYMAGHRYLGSTEKYLRFDVEGLRKSLKACHPFY